MKHIVNVTISNPAHDFVSMRSRQSTTNYMVEAKNEAEAILRASKHFKSLGHYVHNAVIVEQNLNEEVEQIDELSSGLVRRYGGKAIRAHLTAKAKGDTATALKRAKGVNLASAKAFPNSYLPSDRAKVPATNEEAERQVEPPPSAMPSDTRIKPLPKAKKGVRIGSTNKFGHYTPGMKEEIEQIDELKKSTLASYITKAARQSSGLYSLGKEFDDDKYKYAKKALKARTPKTKEQAKTDMETAGRLAKTFTRKAHNRTAGISRAAVKMAKEEVEQVVEKAPPGAKYERMVKHIKNQYSKDGTLTPKEKAIAYATAWKAKNSGK